MQRAVPQLIAEMKARGYRVSIYSALRTEREQLALIAKGHSTARVSKHMLGRAVDLLISPEKGYKVAGQLWTDMGGIWGGNFKNPELAKVEYAHFEDGSPQPSGSPSRSVQSRSGSGGARRRRVVSRSARSPSLPLWYMQTVRRSRRR